MKHTLSSLIALALLLCLSACKQQQSPEQRAAPLAEEWAGREIRFPDSLVFTRYGRDFVADTIPVADYKIVSYLDSLGCSGCKLRLPSWQGFIRQLADNGLDVPILFILHPQNVRTLKASLLWEKFDYPVCLDTDDRFNRLNRLPQEADFQTFLLDRDNRVVAAGNPVYSMRVRDLYLSLLLSGGEQTELPPTTAVASATEIDLGTFPVSTRRDTTVYVKNTGHDPLAVLDLQTSCGCTQAAYEPKTPVAPGDSLALHIVYEENKVGEFMRNVLLFCNTADSPLSIYVTGKMEE